MLTPDIFQSIPWQTPWRFVRIGEGSGYERWLLQEVRPGHPLYGQNVVAVGVRVDRDDVLFLLPKAAKPLAVVTLAYSPDAGEDDEEDTHARLPITTFYDSLEDWLSRGMAADHADYLRGGRDDMTDE